MPALIKQWAIRETSVQLDSKALLRWLKNVK
jgi:hypothetical protein